MSIILKIFPDIDSYRKARRLVRLVIGGTVLLVGIFLLVLPGPAFVVIPVGLAILAGELVWARVLLKRVKHFLSKKQRADDKSV